MIGETRPLVIILGPTGVGKTRLALELALRLNGEIVGADSRQIYRGMDIGTAKPTAEQQALVRHHLIDIAPPDYKLSLAEYQDAAYQAIDALHQRGKLPLLVGGSGQYITAVEEGWGIPRVPPNPELRAELEEYAARKSPQALHDKLRKVDAVSAARIHPNNTRRLIRALEVQNLTGRAISELQIKEPPPYRILRLGLMLPRSLLYPRVDARVDAMIAAGFVDEVRQLLDMGYARDLPSMTGLGYLEIAAHLLDGASLELAIERTKFNTHEFIRRQDVWFRGHDNGILWHNVADLHVDALADELQAWLAKSTDAQAGDPGPGDMTDKRLTHLDDQGEAAMVDVGEKAETRRLARAAGRVMMNADTLRLIRAGEIKKGDVLSIARIAGIMAAKRASELIPLCHPLPLDKIRLEIELNEDESAVAIEATVKTTGKTGVEMEALTAVSVAALTIYDMAKAVDRGMRIGEIRLLEKRGGARGDYLTKE